MVISYKQQVQGDCCYCALEALGDMHAVKGCRLGICSISEAVGLTVFPMSKRVNPSVFWVLCQCFRLEAGDSFRQAEQGQDHVLTFWRQTASLYFFSVRVFMCQDIFMFSFSLLNKKKKKHEDSCPCGLSCSIPRLSFICLSTSGHFPSLCCL